MSSNFNLKIAITNTNSIDVSIKVVARIPPSHTLTKSGTKELHLGDSKPIFCARSLEEVKGPRVTPTWPFGPTHSLQAGWIHGNQCLGIDGSKLASKMMKFPQGGPPTNYKYGYTSAYRGEITSVTSNYKAIYRGL